MNQFSRGPAIALLFVAAIAFGCASRPEPAPPMTLATVETLASPAGDYSAQPQLSVQGDRLILSWLERTGGATVALKFAERTATGWSETRKAASGDEWFVNWADVPSVVRLADGSLAAHWLQISGTDSYAYDVRLAFSHDDGKTWSASTTPHHDGAPVEHGFASLFQAPGAGLGLVWLDGRAMKSAKPGEEPEGAMGLRAAVFDAKGSQVSETVVDDLVCECCPTAAALTSDGPIVAFRNRSKEEIRDIYVSRLTGGKWSEPVPVHDDGWQINACPVNGPALSARDRNVAIAWFTVAGDQGRVFAAFSADAGKTFGQPIRVDEAGAIGRVDVELLPDGAAVVAWIESANGRSEFRVRRVEPTGTPAESANVAAISANRASGYPRLARVGNELIVAWTDAEANKVRTAKVQLKPKAN